MKSDVDPYEFIRWKSSRGRLVVRTTWVKGVRHVVLDDDDDEDKTSRTLQRHHHHNNRLHDKNAATKTNHYHHCASSVDKNSPVRDGDDDDENANDDDNYVERVLQWLQTPAAVLKTCRKPMSAPGNHGTAYCPRRPALVKTCSIPDNDKRSEHAMHQVHRTDKRNVKTSISACRLTDINHQKTELHVHMPSVCPPNSKDNSKIFDDDYLSLTQ